MAVTEVVVVKHVVHCAASYHIQAVIEWKFQKVEDGLRKSLIADANTNEARCCVSDLVTEKSKLKRFGECHQCRIESSNGEFIVYFDQVNEAIISYDLRQERKLRYDLIEFR